MIDEFLLQVLSFVFFCSTRNAGEHLLSIIRTLLMSSLSRCARVIDVDLVTSVADTGTSAEYSDAAVKSEHVVITIDKKALEVPTGMLVFSIL